MPSRELIAFGKQAARAFTFTMCASLGLMALTYEGILTRTSGVVLLLLAIMSSTWQLENTAKQDP